MAGSGSRSVARRARGSERAGAVDAVAVLSVRAEAGAGSGAGLEAADLARDDRRGPGVGRPEGSQEQTED